MSALILLLASLSANATVVERVAAVVDEEVITLSDVYDLGGSYINERCTAEGPRCRWEMEVEVLDALIQRALVRRELKRLELTVSGEDVDLAIDSVIRNYKLADRDALRQQVEASGVSWETYREQIQEQLQVQRFQSRILAPRVSVRDDEVSDRYRKGQAAPGAASVQIEAIGVPLPSGAGDDVIAKVKEQATFVSDDLRSGEISWKEAASKFDGAGLADAVAGRSFKKSELTPELAAAIFSAKEGEITDPVQVGTVLFIVRVVSFSAASADPTEFEKVKEQLRDQIFQEKIDHAEEEWYQRARRQAAVQVLLPEP